MLEAEAIVVGIEGDTTWVAPQSPGGCGGDRCASNGCGTGSLVRLFSQTPKPVRADNAIGAAVGERVLVGLPDGQFLKTALAVYLLPLSALLAGAGFGMAWFGTDLHAGLGGLGGLLLSLLVLKSLPRRITQIGALPKILRRV